MFSFPYEYSSTKAAQTLSVTGKRTVGSVSPSLLLCDSINSGVLTAVQSSTITVAPCQTQPLIRTLSSACSTPPTPIFRAKSSEVHKLISRQLTFWLLFSKSEIRG